MSGDVFVCTCKPDDAEPGCAYCMGTHYVLATDYADMQAAFDSCNRLSILRWRVILELQAKLDAVTKAAQDLRLLACDLELCRPDQDLSTAGRKHYATRINEIAQTLQTWQPAGTALTDQGRAGEGR